MHYQPHYEAINHRYEEVNRHHEAINRHREAVNRHYEAINRHREEVNRHREAVNRHREAVNRHREGGCLTVLRRCDGHRRSFGGWFPVACPYAALMGSSTDAHAHASTVQAAEISVILLTVSDRGARGEREDRSGPAASEALREAGFEAIRSALIPDGREVVESALSDAIEADADLVLTLGGTGVGPRDETPEGTRPLIERELPGVAEGLRSAGAAKVPTAVLSRGLAGISTPSANGHRSVIVNLPGSTGGARDGVEYLAPILPHLIDQLRGGDH